MLPFPTVIAGEGETDPVPDPPVAPPTPVAGVWLTRPASGCTDGATELVARAVAVATVEFLVPFCEAPAGTTDGAACPWRGSIADAPRDGFGMATAIGRAVTDTNGRGVADVEPTPNPTLGLGIPAEKLGLASRVRPAGVLDGFGMAAATARAVTDTNGRGVADVEPTPKPTLGLEIPAEKLGLASLVRPAGVFDAFGIAFATAGPVTDTNGRGVADVEPTPKPGLLLGTPAEKLGLAFLVRAGEGRPLLPVAMTGRVGSGTATGAAAVGFGVCVLVGTGPPVLLEEARGETAAVACFDPTDAFGVCVSVARGTTSAAAFGDERGVCVNVARTDGRTKTFRVCVLWKGLADTNGRGVTDADTDAIVMAIGDRSAVELP